MPEVLKTSQTLIRIKIKSTSHRNTHKHQQSTRSIQPIKRPRKLDKSTRKGELTLGLKLTREFLTKKLFPTTKSVDLNKCYYILWWKFACANRLAQIVCVCVCTNLVLGKLMFYGRLNFGSVSTKFWISLIQWANCKCCNSIRVSFVFKLL